jgi:hypothetical protein
MEDDGSLVIDHGADYGTELFMNHLARLAKQQMQRPDIEEYKRLGLRQVG